MNWEYYDKYINKKTKGRCDVTPIFRDPEVFSNLIKDFNKMFKKDSYDIIVGLDALGFIIASAMSQKQKKGLVVIRKGGKLPGIKGTIIRTSFTDYTNTKKTFEMNKSAIKKGEKVLIVDEWIETGTQAKAAIKLVEKQGGKVIGIATMAAHNNKKTKILFEKYNCKTIRQIK